MVPQLIERGEFSFPYLGVGMREVTPAIAEANVLNASEGVMIVETADGGRPRASSRGLIGW